MYMIFQNNESQFLSGRTITDTAKDGNTLRVFKSFKKRIEQI